MNADRSRWSCWLLVALMLVAVGCSSEPRSGGCWQRAKVGADRATQSTAATDAEETQPSPTNRFVLGDLVEPFDPPPLAELDKTAEWQDRPVLDGMDVLREQQDAEQPPPIPVAEALALRNTSDVENEKILNSLGRVPPPDGKGVDYDAKMGSPRGRRSEEHQSAVAQQRHGVRVPEPDRRSTAAGCRLRPPNSTTSPPRRRSSRGRRAKTT